MIFQTNIYPSELTLEPSHGAGLEDNFLDLNISISDNNKLSFKIYNKMDDSNFEVINFPFPESNIHSNITYQRFSHSYFDMQGFVVIKLILKIDVKS